ncbi:hypothetical protein [Chengkuizengella marina]|uniref:Uncharacterized protein n=1 Tax=Chengkuizengella marina TaxID=2507566 RepID=A0A6N9Q9C4_9BACL|nr:hypothetical protein [Chengkuizengella marina]NBI31184.1 hypothetical protein [Chengkuizengella marina]
MNKIKKILIFGLVIIFIVLFIRHQMVDDLYMMKRNTGGNSPLISNSQTKINLDTNIRLYLISDLIGNLHYFLFDGRKLVSTSIICNLKNIESNTVYRDVYWAYFEDPGVNSIFTGVIINKNIDKILVKDLKEEDISYIEYRGYKLFYSSNEIESILIKGLSPTNEIVYKNYN